MNYIDLFCGAGGMTLGFEMESFKNIFSNEISPDFAQTYKHNFPDHNLIIEDISKISNEKILELVDKNNIDVIIGGPPCQGFSMAGNIGRKFVDDPRNQLFKEFVRFVDVIRPTFFIMENVARLDTHNSGKTKEEIIMSFQNLGYTVESKVFEMSQYGVPQKRRRIIIIGSLKNKKIIFPEKENNILTVYDAIGHLPSLKSGEESKVPNHVAMNHTEQMLEKMSFVKEGGDRFCIPENIRPTSGDVRKYIRYNRNEPSFCITGDMRKVFHYDDNRALTVRELAAIQTFPDDFIFKGKSISQQQQVGNSVPPNFARKLAKCIKKMSDINE
ncbi:DNA cytosine methyltransferase [Empedobacter brevis]